MQDVERKGAQAQPVKTYCDMPAEYGTVTKTVVTKPESSTRKRSWPCTKPAR